MSSRPDYIFEIHQLWQSGFSRVYSNSCCSCSFEAEIIKLGQSFYKMYSNHIVNFQESMTISNAYRKKVWKLIICPTYVYIYIYIYIYICIYICIYIYMFINLMQMKNYKSRLSFKKNSQVDRNKSEHDKCDRAVHLCCSFQTQHRMVQFTSFEDKLW